jgi:boron transporter
MPGTTVLSLPLPSSSSQSEFQSLLFNLCALRLQLSLSVLPGIAFSLDLIETTEKYGVTEVLIASFMAAFIFSVFGAQPLTIAGVTGMVEINLKKPCLVSNFAQLLPIGPITVFNKTIFDILNRHPSPPNYLQFIGCVYFWGAIFHWITAILNCKSDTIIEYIRPPPYLKLIVCNFLKYVTLFSCDTFGFYVSWVYLQYGIQILTRQFVPADSPSAQGVLVSIILAISMLVASFLFQSLSQTSYFHPHVRRFLADYGMPISLVAASAMAYWGRFNGTNPLTLPIAGAFRAAGGRQWLVKFWEIEAKWVGIALPFGIILWILFFFDHNVSVSQPVLDVFMQ